MVLGERIKRIRMFRGPTQRELVLKLEYEERNADVCIAQYESGYCVPKNNTLMEMAKILNVNYIHFIGVTPGKCNASDDKSVRYYDNEDWPAHTPVDMWLEYGLVNDFMREWCLRKEQLKSGEISEDEYFEWKINWTAMSSSVDEKGNDKKNNSYKWKKQKT